MRITRFGHACVLVETTDARVLVDPGAFSPDGAFEIGELDAVVVTHQHADHLDRERLGGLLGRNRDALLLAEPETAAELGEAWTPTADGVSVSVRSTRLTGVGEQHAEILPDIARIGNVGVQVTAPGQPTFFHPGDSYATAPQGVDVLALPLGAPWAKLSETVDFLRRVAPRTYFPVHDRTISDLAYGMYWNQSMAFGGVEDGRRLGQDDSTEV